MVHQVRAPVEQVGLQYFAKEYFDRFSMTDWGHERVRLDNTQSAFHIDGACDNWNSFLFPFNIISLVQKSSNREQQQKWFAVRTMLHNKCVYNLKLWLIFERYQFSGE